MGELSIKITIANRVYPLTIQMEEEEQIRKAAKKINDRIQEYEQNYSVRDKQDLLAMCALEFANDSTDEQGEVIEPEMVSKLKGLDEELNSYLEG